MRDPKLIGKFAAALPAPAKRPLDDLHRIAEPKGLPLYLVGGPLRDLVLDRPSLDIDIAVEGDAIALARELAEAANTRAVTHPAFLTASVRIAGHHLDLITARSETYARPGALPTVHPATIREDILRRDFTINALGLRLNGPETGEVLDPTGGLADLDARLIRALHERSFQDDATRILRAFRYAVRLSFEVESETLTWLRRDLNYLDTISGARLHREFARILAEPAPEQTLLRPHELGALTAIHPALRFDGEHAAAFRRLRELHHSGARAAYWPVLAWGLSEPEAADIGRRLALTNRQRAAVEAMPALRDLESDLQRQDQKRSAIAELLALHPMPALWAFAALTEDPAVRDRLLDYLTKARHERPHLTGDDLLALGAAEGPALGEILRRLRSARLNGQVMSRGDEERLVRGLLVGGEPSSTVHLPSSSR